MDTVAVFQRNNFHKKTTFKFHKVVHKHYSGEVKNVCNTLYKFTQDIMYQLLPELTDFCGRYGKTLWLTFYLDKVYIVPSVIQLNAYRI